MSLGPDSLATIETAARAILVAIGEDPTRPELEDTPARFARWWSEFMGYRDDNRATVFPASKIDQMVVVAGVRVWSLCEHHLLPFYCDVSMAYIISEHVLGLSKFGRIAHAHAHKLQTQERLVEEIAAELAEVARTESVAVLARGEHLCMTMRGIKTPACMTSSALHGLFKHDSAARAEFLTLSNGAPHGA